MFGELFWALNIAVTDEERESAYKNIDKKLRIDRRTADYFVSRFTDEDWIDYGIDLHKQCENEKYGFRLWDNDKLPTNNIESAYYIEVFNEDAIDVLIAITKSSHPSTPIPWIQYDSYNNLAKTPGLYGYDEDLERWINIIDRMRECQEIVDTLGYLI